MAKDYKSTLNLPKTAFPMKANLAQREPEMLKYWEEIKLYETIEKQTEGKQPFILMDGPLYANGKIHLGHALNRILKDMVVKSKLLSGFRVPFIPGWDCHGLPIELQVEKKVGKPGQKISPKVFREKCREFVEKQVSLQKAEFIRLGELGDWQNPYRTMDFTFQANIVRAFGKILEKGYVVRGNKPVHWCLECRSSLAEAEVEYRDKTSPSIYVAFTLEQTPDTDIIIWTTTPWTLPANQAVSVHPDLAYVLVKAQEKQFIVADALLNDFLAQLNIQDATVVDRFLGKTLEGRVLQHPFYDKTIPVILGDHVTLEAGTGCVHTAPAHGLEDFLVSQKYDLPLDNPVGGDGCFIENTPVFAGMHVKVANEPIIDLLKTKGKLLFLKDIVHSFPHCWRHKTPLIFRATPQWFISMKAQDLRSRVLDCTQQVRWYPKEGEARFESMVKDRPDWCISRQRTWGVPIPLFVHKETGQRHPDSVALIEKLAQEIEQAGIEAWFDLDVTAWLGEQAECYEKSTDTLDVWFDSGVVHSVVGDTRKALSFPANLYLEGSDQHRGWFQSSMITAVAMKGQAPYQAVLTHGFTVDGQGHKMSKSLGNIIAPEKVIQQLGADVLRLWVASTDYHYDMSVSEEILKRMSDAYRRIRNTTRFLLANLAGFNPKTDLVEPNEMIALDQYIVSLAKIKQAEILQGYETYQFHVIYQKIHNFCVVDLGNFYLDIIKDRQYTCQANSLARRSAQTALYHIVQALVRWLAPILSFTAEEIWQSLDHKQTESVFLAQWYEGLFDLPPASSLNHDFWQQIRKIRDEVNKALEFARQQGAIGSPLEARVSLYVDAKNHELLEKLGVELRFVLITSKALLKPIADSPPEAFESTLAGLKISVEAAEAAKCQRCWHRLEEVGQNSAYPEICHRCVENITTKGEQRTYA